MFLMNSPLPTLHVADCDALVLSARERQSLTVVRSLGKHGLRVAALESSNGLTVPAFSSRWCQHKAVYPAHLDTEKEVACIEQVLDATGSRVLIPTSDSSIALIRHYRERLEQRAAIAIARESALAIATSKERTLEIAKKSGLRIPRGVMLGNVNEVGSALHEIGLPAVIKPIKSRVIGEHLGDKTSPQLVTTVDEARRVVEELTLCHGEVLFQQYLTGRRESISFFYAKGQVYARFAQWAKRTNPPIGGVSVLRQSMGIPIDIGEQAEQFVREIGLEGYSEAVFRRDRAGYPYLMEISPRLSASIELAARAGIDFPYLLYRWANGERIDAVKWYRRGLWMRYLGGDIATTLASFRQRGRPGIPSPARAILEFSASCFTPMRYDYLDWSDPLPAWTAAVGFPRTLARQARVSFSKNRI